MVAARHTMIAIAAMSDLGGTERRVWGPRPASGTGLTTDGVQPGLSPSAVAVLSPVAALGDLVSDQVPRQPRVPAQGGRGRRVHGEH